MSEVDKIITEISPYYKSKGGPSSEHELIYDSSSELLEPIYFWILDFMNNMFGGDVKKLVDNFTSSPGSNHFSEMGQRASLMQQNATNLLGQVNTVLKSVINILYDLREWQMILKSYDAVKSQDPNEREAGLLSLKQRWMDKVDVLRGVGSINQLSSGNLQFVTLRDAFMQSKTLKDVDRLDLNDRVKKILKARILEFNDWLEKSERELRKRFEIEKTYLKSQVNTLKLYSRWAKPYLRSAQELATDEKLGQDPARVSMFSTFLLELTLLGKNSVGKDDLPTDLQKVKARKYYSVVVVDFYFRGIPNKVGQGYTFGGRAEVNFRAYSLNEDELLLLEDKLDRSDLNDALKLVEGMTDESLAQLNIDLDEFLNDAPKKQEKNPNDTNPFSALFSVFMPEKKQEEKEKIDPKIEKLKELKEKGIKHETYAEKFLRNIGEANAVNSCYTIYDIYKKAHGMPSFPYIEDAEPSAPTSKTEEFFGFGEKVNTDF